MHTLALKLRQRWWPNTQRPLCRFGSQAGKRTAHILIGIIADSKRPVTANSACLPDRHRPPRPDYPANVIKLSRIATSQRRHAAADNAREHANLGPQLAYFLTECLDVGIPLARLLADQCTDLF